MLTGGPAAGKSTCGRALASRLGAAAFIDVDDIRQLIVAGAATPWEGPVGMEQMSLAARNACALGTNMINAGFETVIADVLTPQTAGIYRRQLSRCLIVHLKISWPEAQRRAATRAVYLTEEEFAWLHAHDGDHPPDADLVLDVDGLGVERQIQALEDIWSSC